MRRFYVLLLIASGLVFAPPALAAEPTSVHVTVTGLPERVASGQSLTLRLGVSGFPAEEAEVEVRILVAGRSVTRSVWKVPVEDGRGEMGITLAVPEARVRVPLQIAAVLEPEGEAARADAVLLPRWTPERLADALRGKDVAVLDDSGLIAPTLGQLAFQRVAPTDPLGVERFTGDLIVCHIPQFSPASEGVVTALSHALLQGRSVVWLVQEGEAMPPALHSGPLVSVNWPFTLQPRRELQHTRPEDLLCWAGEKSSLSLPVIASFGTAWLVVCSDRIVADMDTEAAAGWLWEDLLRWAVKPPLLRAEIKRLTFDDRGPYQYQLAPPPVPSSAVLSLAGPAWVQPSEQRLLWLEEVGKLLERGNALLVTGADAERVPALRALGLPALDFVPVAQSTGITLGPNLLLWGIGRTDPHYGLLARQGERPLLGSSIGSRTGTELFREFRIGKGLLLLCQPNFDEAEIGLSADLLDHLATQLLNAPGESLLEEGTSP